MAIINKTQFIITKDKAEDAEIFPAGISLVTVLGFLASIFLSKYLLKAIAAFRAKTIHSITSANKSQLNGFFEVVTPRKNPIKANGNANIVCENLTKER